MPTNPYTIFLVYAGAVVLIAAVMLGLSALLGQRHSEPATGQPYESGVRSIGSARLRVSVKFWLVAILFVIFDLEMVYLFAWAVALRELGWPGYWGLLVFVGILGAALVYEWKMGILDWATNPPRDRGENGGRAQGATGQGRSADGRAAMADVQSQIAHRAGPIGGALFP
jgi:NADH-quinone oxidoreductase subunit A